ncbi:MAG: hypothetical protein ACOX17_07600 [Christensenellales bacterium]|jgi:uncharacterized protein with ACT and thioredoxin-like domain
MSKVIKYSSVVASVIGIIADITAAIKVSNNNLVHVKLYLKRSVEITDELYLEIIDNLKEIIDSRRILS